MPPRLVVVGGSAGGMESLRLMAKELPADFPAPIVAVLHLDPHTPSKAASLLAVHTTLKVRQAVAGQRLEAGTLYLATPDRHLVVRAGRIELTRAARVHYSRPSVDKLLESAAKSYGPRTLAVILSGNGADGSTGLRAIKAAGGMCVAEDPATAEFAGMPEAAVATGCVDAVLPAGRLASYLTAATGAGRTPVTAETWREVAALLRSQCGIDFQGYRMETLRRRMEARMAATGTATAPQYVALLRRDAAEVERLRSALLVKVSSFMRDKALWTILERRVLSELARDATRREIRMWSAGCATGEEAYSLAMLCLAANRNAPVKVFATDVDGPSLAKGRAGKYPASAVALLPRSLSKRFFQAEGEHMRTGPELRRHVIFGRQDLVRDPPLAGMDVVVCRNVLIYLKPAQRQQVLERLANSLRPGGVLFLGKAEGAPVPGPGFTRIAPGAPIFRRTGSLSDGPIVAVPKRKASAKAAPAIGAPIVPRAEPVLFAVDGGMRVTIWNRAAEEAFGVSSRVAIGTLLSAVIGAPGQEWEKAIPAAMATGRRSRMPDIELANPARSIGLEGVPLPGGVGLMLIGHARMVPRGARKAKVPAPDAELEETQQALNEELQSRNEELETVNEELQSLNDEIQVQGDEARRATLFLGALLDAGPDVIVGCDRQGLVTFWGTPAVRQFGLSAAQALGKDLLRLVPVLDTPAVRKRLRQGGRWTKGARAVRSIKVGNDLRVALFPAMDSDGRAHGTLLRLVAPTPPAPPAAKDARAKRARK